jgi:divalent metal cation (Fe/Co/Zn/Cd) transporter
MYGSFAVIGGLVLTKLGYAWGDAAAAICVAIAISILGLRLGRETIESLLDRAPEGATERVREAIAAVAGVVTIKQLRLRLVGAKHFVDAEVEVPRTWPIDRIDGIKTAAEAAVREALTDADLTFTAVPVARDNESVRDRIMVIARNRALAVHHVTVHDVGGRLTVSIDLEVDGGMSLDDAHEITRALEAAIRDEFGADVEADTHIEPLEPEAPPGSDASPAVVNAIREALTRLTADQGLMHDVHNVRVRDTETGQIVNYHCRAAGDLPVREVHDRVDEIERAIRKSFPTVKRVIGHAEPNID